MLFINLANSDKNRITRKVTARTRARHFLSHRPSGRDRKVMDPGTDPADTPDSFLLRSLTTARNSYQDFRGTVLSGAVCSFAVSLPDVSIFSTRCSCCCRLFREVIRRPTSTSATVPARSCRHVDTLPGESESAENVTRRKKDGL